jgi:hypothetical protein
MCEKGRARTPVSAVGLRAVGSTYWCRIHGGSSQKQNHGCMNLRKYLSYVRNKRSPVHG